MGYSPSPRVHAFMTYDLPPIRGPQAAWRVSICSIQVSTPEGWWYRVANGPFAWQEKAWVRVLRVLLWLGATRRRDEYHNGRSIVGDDTPWTFVQTIHYIRTIFMLLIF